MPDFGDVGPNGETSARTQFEGTTDPWAPSVSNGQISPEAYAEYQRKRRRDAILGVLSVLGGTIGLGAAGQALGGAGAAGSATTGSATGSLGAIEGGSPWAVTPYAGTAASVPTGAAAVGGSVGAGAGAAGALAGMTPAEWAQLGLGTASAIGPMVSGQHQNFAPNTTTTDPNLMKLIQSMQGRLDKSEPLYGSILNMANGLLPTQYQNGGAGRG